METRITGTPDRVMTRCATSPAAQGGEDYEVDRGRLDAVGDSPERRRDRSAIKPRLHLPVDIVVALAGVDCVHFGGFGPVPKQPKWIRPDVTFVAAALPPSDAISHIARRKSFVDSLSAIRAAAILAIAFACGIVFATLIFWGTR